MDGQLVVFKFKLTTKSAEFSNKPWGYLFNKTWDGTWSPLDIPGLVNIQKAIESLHL